MKSKMILLVLVLASPILAGLIVGGLVLGEITRALVKNNTELASQLREATNALAVAHENGIQWTSYDGTNGYWQCRHCLATISRVTSPPAGRVEVESATNGK